MTDLYNVYISEIEGNTLGLTVLTKILKDRCITFNIDCYLEESSVGETKSFYLMIIRDFCYDKNCTLSREIPDSRVTDDHTWVYNNINSYIQHVQLLETDNNDEGNKNSNVLISNVHRR